MFPNINSSNRSSSEHFSDNSSDNSAPNIGIDGTNVSKDGTYSNVDLEKVKNMKYNLLSKEDKKELYEKIIENCNPIMNTTKTPPEPIKDKDGVIIRDCFMPDITSKNYIIDTDGKYIPVIKDIDGKYIPDLLNTGEYKKDTDGSYLTIYHKMDPKTGKYVFDNTKFNNKRFNEIFNSYTENAIKNRNRDINANNTNNKSQYKPFYQLNLLEIVLELKNTMFSILDDILGGNMTLDIILKENRLFYVGLTILIIAIILYIYDYAIDPTNTMANSNGLVEIRHIYEKRD